MGWLTSPHQMLASLEGSRTMNLSFGERPVCVPVRTTSGPSAAISPSPSRIAASYRAAFERFATILPARTRVAGWAERGLDRCVVGSITADIGVGLLLRRPGRTQGHLA